MSQLTDFGNTAKNLARNPLGIIALFIVLIYGFASLVVGVSGKLEAAERLPIVWFLVLFPVAVLAAFTWLVARHHNKLYAPSDFKDESHFILSQTRALQKLPLAEPSAGEESAFPLEAMESGGDSLDTEAGRAKHRYEVYADSHDYFLVHSYEPSTTSGQEFDVFIYLKHHQSDNYRDIANTEFFLGRYWGNKIFTGKKVGNIIGIRASAYGPFLCTCRITFQSGKQVIVSRYIDFEMAAKSH